MIAGRIVNHLHILSVGCVLVGAAVARAQTPATQASASPQPKGLLALEEYRATHLKKGEVQWSQRVALHGEHSREDNQWGVMNYTSRFAPDSQLWVRRGDDNGLMRTVDGTFTRLQGYTMLMEDGTVAFSTGDAGIIGMYPPGDPSLHKPNFEDVRAIDLSVEFGDVCGVHAALWKSGLEQRGRVSYRERPERDLFVVEAEAISPEGTHHEYVYWLDPKRGWNPVRTEYRLDGEWKRRTTCTLKQYDGIWFPENIVRLMARYENGEKPTELLTVHSARFTGPLPDSLTLRDLGAEVGTNLFYPSEPGKPANYLMWDGARGIDPEEFHKKLAAGELVRGPNFMKSIMGHQQQAEDKPAAALAGTNTEAFAEKPAESIQDAWEQYVRAFIREHELAGAQQDSAMAVLADCKKQTQQYVQSKRPRFDELRKLRDAVRDLQNMKADPAAKTKQMKTLAEELAKPLDAIFETSLKPRLLGLLTAEQRKAAAPTTTQPDRGKQS